MRRNISSFALFLHTALRYNNKKCTWNAIDRKAQSRGYNIYALPDLSEFDGIVMDCTNISDKYYFD